MDEKDKIVSLFHLFFTQWTKQIISLINFLSCIMKSRLFFVERIMKNFSRKKHCEMHEKNGLKVSFSLKTHPCFKRIVLDEKLCEISFGFLLEPRPSLTSLDTLINLTVSTLGVQNFYQSASWEILKIVTSSLDVRADITSMSRLLRDGVG